MPRKPSPRSNLPRLSATFVGRRHELARLDALLFGGTSLVTIAGPPGMGKTRLALRCAEQWLHGRPNTTAWLCDLSEAAEPDAAIRVVARVLGVELPNGLSGVPLAIAIGDALRERGRTLLVLDNFERLAPDALSIVPPLLDRAPGVQLLVTSRERLRLAGETLLELDP